MVECVKDMQISNEQLKNYVIFPEKEESPCLFKCFADKMNFYSSDYKQWHLDNWITAFGPLKSKNKAIFTTCNTKEVYKAKTNQCAWMYSEYICFENLNSYSTSKEPEFVSTTTLKSIIMEERTTPSAMYARSIVKPHSHPHPHLMKL